MHNQENIHIYIFLSFSVHDFIYIYTHYIYCIYYIYTVYIIFILYILYIYTHTQQRAVTE